MSDEAPVKAGDVLAQKYRVDRVLGVGGMGVVVAATHIHLDQRVALKFMLPEAFRNPEAVGRFHREAKAAVKLKSEHVARVLDTGMFDNNSPYIVMEYLEGSDLAGELEKFTVLPIGLVAEYIIHACEALAEAHSLGIVHRDLKPANLFLTKRADGSPLVKVLDFGISKVSSLTEGGLAMTKTASMMGSPLYMSPEQMRSAKEVDQRTDVWSLGIIMYELLGGRVPFNSDTLGGLLSMVMMEAHPPLETIRPDLPRELCALVNHCLEKNVNQRAANVGVIAVGLAPFAPSRALPIVDRVTTLIGGAPADYRPSLVSAATVHAPGISSAQTGTGWGTTGPGPVPKRSSIGLILGGLAGLVLLVSAVGFAGYKLKGKSAASVDQPIAVTSTLPSTTPPPQPSAVQPVVTPATTATIATSPSSLAITPAAGPTVTAHTTTIKPVRSAAPTASAPPVVASATATATAQPTASHAKPGILETSN